MAEEANLSNRLQEELDGALQSLESSLTSAAQAATAIRNALPQIAALAEVIGDVEAAVTRIRPQLEKPTPTGQGGSPWLRALPKEEPAATAPVAPATPEPQPESPEFEPIENAAPSEQAIADSETEEEPSGVSHCLRVDVTTETSSLDLKAVDGAVNETAEVVDVALLDYDGRRASLKVWLDEAADAQRVREKLLESLQRRLDGETDIQISFEKSAA